MALKAVLKQNVVAVNLRGEEFELKTGELLIHHFDTVHGAHFGVPILKASGNSGIVLERDEFEWLEGERIEYDMPLSSNG